MTFSTACLLSLRVKVAEPRSIRSIASFSLLPLSSPGAMLATSAALRPPTLPVSTTMFWLRKSSNCLYCDPSGSTNWRTTDPSARVFSTTRPFSIASCEACFRNFTPRVSTATVPALPAPFAPHLAMVPPAVAYDSGSSKTSPAKPRSALAVLFSTPNRLRTSEK